MMMVENSFDLWRKDVFFSAAEEVQESADIMESVYRAWERVRRDEDQSDQLDEICRELQTALGTAKWQLEEFVKAIQLSHENGSSEHTIARHSQFVIAIEDQISRVEEALRGSLIGEGKQPLRWVQLDEEERDDLAVFLAGTSGNSQDVRESYANIRLPKVNFVQQFQHKKDLDNGENALHERSGPEYLKGFKEVVTIKNDAKYVVELEAKDVPKTKNDVQSYSKERLDAQRATWSSEDVGSWRIMIADEDLANNTMDERKEISNREDNLCGLLRSIDFGNKFKGFRNSFGKEKDEEHLGSERPVGYLNLKRIFPFTQGVNLFNESSRNCFSGCREDTKVSHVRQLFGRVGGLKRHVQGIRQYMPINRSLQVTLLLLLTILLIVPFMLYAN